jgi:hypothetical protein
MADSLKIGAGVVKAPGYETLLANGYIVANSAVLTWIRRRRSTRILEMELCSMMWNEKAENEQ